MSVYVSAELHHSDTGASKPHVLIAESAHAVHSGEILAYVLPQRSGAGAMEYAHPPGIELQGIVDEICHGLHCFIGTHSAHIDVGLETQLSLSYFVACRGADE